MRLSPVAVTTSVKVPPVSTPARAGRHQRREGRSGRAQVGRAAVSVATLLGGGGGDGQAVDEVVEGVFAVTLDPAETDAVLVGQIGEDQRLPQVPVGDRLLLAVDPAPGQPPLPPAVPEAVDHVGRVADHLERPVDSWSPPPGRPGSPCAGWSCAAPPRWRSARRGPPTPNRRARGSPGRLRRCTRWWGRTSHDPGTTTARTGGGRATASLSRPPARVHHWRAGTPKPGPAGSGPGAGVVPAAAASAA